MSKKFTKTLAFVMALLMVITILPAEYLIGNAFDSTKNALSFVDTGDSEVKISGKTATIEAQTYQKTYELKYQLHYAIDYSAKESYAPGEMVYMLPALAFYNNGATAGYILPKDIEMNNTGSEIWESETTTVDGKKVVLIKNKIELTPEVVTDGFMQFAATINPRTQMVGATLYAIQVRASEDGGANWNDVDSLTWNCNLYADAFHIGGEIKDVEVENASELGADADDYYWAKYEINVTSTDEDWHSVQATDFKFTFVPTAGAEIYSINGNKNPAMDGNNAVVDFNFQDWSYTSNVGSKDFVVIMKYPKATFDGSTVQNICKLDTKLNGATEFSASADCELRNTLNDYKVHYDGDLFAVMTDRNPGYEISWNSLARKEASPFSFYMSAISRYNGEYNVTIENDHLEILDNNGNFRRLDPSEYAINRVIINDLSHFKNAVGEQYTSLSFAVLDKDMETIKTGEVGNAPQTIALPADSHYVAVAFYGLDKSLYIDSTAIQTVGVINVKDANAVMKEGELRNLVGLLVMNDEGVMNTVDASNYDGEDGARLAQADMDEYGYYVQRDYATQVVTYKASQINVATKFNPAKSVYNETSKKQESTMDIEAFFAAPGEVSSFSLYTVLPEGMNAGNDVAFSAESALHLADGSEISASDAPTFLKNYADVTLKEDYKGTGRDYVAIDFNFPKGKEVCYDATMTNGFTSGKITASIPVVVDNSDATYTAVAGMIFNDEHHETITTTKDDGSAKLVNNDSLVWTDINNNGNVDEIVDYATATLTAVFVEAGNKPVDPAPSVKIEKTADKEVYKVGETIVYTLKVTNNGNVALHNVVVTDSLDGTFDAHEKATIDGNKATIAEMKANETITLTYRVEVPADSKDGDKVHNVANVTTDEKVTDEDDVDVTIEVPEEPPVDVPSVKIDKTADKATYNVGETIVYTIKVTNNGNVVLHNVVVTDSMEGTFDAHEKATINGNKATIAELAVGETVSLTYRVKVSESAKNNDKLVNKVNVVTDEKVTDNDDVTVTVVIPNPNKPSIKIEKTADKQVYKVKDTVTYTIKVTNTGNVKLTNVKVTESMDGEFDVKNASVLTVNGRVVNLGSLAPNESKTFTFKYIVPANAKNNDVIKNTVTVTTDENVTDKDDVDVKVEVPATIVEKPSIDIVKTVEKTSYNPGDTAVYTIKVKNNGNVDLKNVKVVETLSGTWKNLSKNVEVKDSMNVVIKELKVGQSETMKFEFKVSDTAKHGSTIKNIVKATEETHKVSDEDDVTITIVDKFNPEIKITKVADRKSVKAGETINYTITVKNTGNVNLKNVNVVDSLTDGKFETLDGATKVNDYTLIIPELKSGESKTFTFSYKVPDKSTAKEISNTATAIETNYNLRVEDKAVVPMAKTVAQTITNIVQTGDNAPLMVMFGLALISLMGMSILAFTGKKRK